MPKMGMQKTKTTASLADALFSTTQQRVLARLFGQPGRSFYANELITTTGGGSGAIQRELVRLERSGLITSERRGSQKHYKANPSSPLFDELCGIARKTVGLAEPLREALAPLAPQIRAAFVYGSIAKGMDTASSDIDLMILSDSVDFATVISAIYPLHAKLGREINPNVFTPAEFAKRRTEGSGFVERVAGQPKLWIIGGEHELGA